MNVPVGRLHVIVGEPHAGGRSPGELAMLAIDGGADTLQLRMKSLPTRALLEVADEIAGICREADVPLIINDRVDIALAARADGVHLGQADVPIAVARRLLGPEKIIGATAPSIGDVLAAADAGADYVGCGHVFATSSKVKTSPPMGLDGLADICRVATLPVVGIGGIGIETASSVIAAGAWGVAVIAAVSHAPDPRGATQRLKQEITTSRASDVE